MSEALSPVVPADQSLAMLDRVIAYSLAGFVAFSMFSISLTQLSFAIGAGAWLYKTWKTQAWREQRFPAGWPFLIFSAACLLAVLTAVNPGKSFKPLKKLLEILIVFWTLNSVKSEEQRELLLRILFLSATLAAFYGFYQALRHGVSLSTRVEGTMSIYMTFAGVLMLAGLLALARLLFKAPREPWLMGVAAVLLLCLLLTLTRQAWLGAAAGLAFLVFFRRRQLLLALPVIAAVALLLAPGAVQERLLSMANLKDQTFLIRMQLWQGGWEIFKDHPLTGCGFKCVDSVYPQYTEYVPVLQRYKGMHNNFLQLAVDTGIIGLAAWLWVWCAYYRELFRQAAPEWAKMAAGGAVAGFLAGGFFEVNFYDSEVIMLLYFIMALPFAATATPASATGSS